MKKILCALLLCAVVLGCCGCSLLFEDKVNEIPLAENVTVVFAFEDGTECLAKEHIESVSLMVSEDTNQIAFFLTDEGSRVLAETTAKNIGKSLEIHINGETRLRSVIIQEEINDTVFLLDMGDDYDECVSVFDILTKNRYS